MLSLELIRSIIDLKFQATFLTNQEIKTNLNSDKCTYACVFKPRQYFSFWCDCAKSSLHSRFHGLERKKNPNTNKKSRLPKFLASILHNEHANKISTSADSCKVPEIRKISKNKSEAAYFFRSRREISP